MIDFEADILTAIQNALEAAEYSGVELYDQIILSPSSFPCVCVEEIDNYNYTPTIDSGCNENHAKVAYEVNVYSNRTYDKRGECKSIFAVVSDALTNLGFIRMSMNPININDTTVCRFVGRFQAVISKTGEIYRR